MALLMDKPGNTAAILGHDTMWLVSQMGNYPGQRLKPAINTEAAL
ncbi:MAG: hypothetical protein ACU83V_07990 [Gammaproteobacteria bacterium]